MNAVLEYDVMRKWRFDAANSTFAPSMVLCFGICLLEQRQISLLLEIMELREVSLSDFFDNDGCAGIGATKMVHIVFMIMVI